MKSSTVILLALSAAAATPAMAKAPAERQAEACGLTAFHSPPGRAHLWKRADHCPKPEPRPDHREQAAENPAEREAKGP